MGSWRVTFSPEAERDLAKLDRPIRRRIIDKLAWLEDNFHSEMLMPLSAEYKEFYKLRVGDWRVVYKVSWKSNTITVSYIDHRSKAYKRK